MASETTEEQQDIASPAHPSAWAPRTLIVTVLLSVLGAFIGLNLVTTLGISANTSVIGALIAMIIGRVGIWGFREFRDTNRQNLVQTAVSSATFGAANALLTPIAIGWAFGRADLVWWLLLGAAGGLAVDSWVLYKTFGSQFLPATAAWPPGLAGAETIKAGDEGGRRAIILGVSGVGGILISWFGLSASAAGVALIGNIAALFMFGIGLMVNQYITILPGFADFSLTGDYIPHGLMIGAGLVALVQATIILSNRKSKRKVVDPIQAASTSTPPAIDVADEATRSPQQLGRGLGSGFVLFIVVAVLLALGTGIATDMSPLGLIGWVVFAAVAAIVHEIIVGLAAMQSGWFPAFAVTLIFLVIGLVAGLPEVPLLVLVGFCASTGPAFADMGYDFKAGWLLRKVHSRHKNYREYEMSGRKQQYYSSIIGFVVALILVALLWRSYFEAGNLPPVSIVFADTIKAGMTNPDAVKNLILWAIPGALIQFLGGTKRQMGIMIATGLLISAPFACWLVFAALLARVIVRRVKGPKAEEELALVGAGLIAGDAIASVGRLFR